MAKLVMVRKTPAGGTTYNVGTGQTYATLTEVPWTTLQPGDTVRVHYSATPYREKLLLSQSGTAANPITVTGVLGPGGERPIIDGEDAITELGAPYIYAPTQNRGVVIFTRRIGQAYGYKPSYWVIENLEIRNGHSDHTYTNAAGDVTAYTDNASGVFVERGENIIVRNCLLTQNGNGFFVACSGDEAGTSRSITLEYSRVFDNGISGSDQQHQVYTESAGMIFQYNWIGPQIAGGIGSSLKDRSVGTVIRFNRVEGGARMLDLVDPEDSTTILGQDPRLHETHVYGNIILNGPSPDAVSIIHYGGDSSLWDTYRKGTLYLYGNTVVIKCNQTGTGARWRTQLLQCDTDDESVDFRNNIVYCGPYTEGSVATELSLLTTYGVFNINGPNWVTTSLDHRTGLEPSAGSSVSGRANLLDSTGNDPGFTDISQVPASCNLELTAASACLDEAGALAAACSAYPVDHEYVHQITSQVRSIVGAAADLGALERG